MDSTEPDWDDLVSRSLRKIIKTQSSAREVTLATVRENCAPNSRTIILRDFKSTPVPQLIFYSDYRADKVTEIKQNRSVSCLIWDRQNQKQIRLSGQCDILHRTDETDKIWQQLSDHSKKLYCHDPAPGATIESPDDYQSVVDEDNSYGNFAILKLEIKSVDYLKLLEHGVRERAQFEIVDSEINGQWIVP